MNSIPVNPTSSRPASPPVTDPNAPVRAAAVAAFAATPKAARRGRPPGSANGRSGSAGVRALAKRQATASSHAKTTAAVILEGLTGLRSAPDSARTLGITVARYYAVEAQALAGLLHACEVAPPGPAPGVATERELARLRQDHRRQEQELARMRAVLRTTQRSLGITPVPSPASTSSATPGAKKRRHRRPVVRALTVVRKLLGKTGSTSAESSAAPTPSASTSRMAPDISAREPGGG